MHETMIKKRQNIINSREQVKRKSDHISYKVGQKPPKSTTINTTKVPKVTVAPPISKANVSAFYLQGHRFRIPPDRLKARL